MVFVADGKKALSAAFGPTWCLNHTNNDSNKKNDNSKDKNDTNGFSKQRAPVCCHVATKAGASRAADAKGASLGA